VALYQHLRYGSRRAEVPVAVATKSLRVNLGILVYPFPKIVHR
jgi:hypothetical protein